MLQIYEVPPGSLVELQETTEPPPGAEVSFMRTKLIVENLDGMYVNCHTSTGRRRIVQAWTLVKVLAKPGEAPMNF